MEECYECQISDEETELKEVIFGGKVVKLCGKCIKTHPVIPLIKPTKEQIDESKRGFKINRKVKDTLDSLRSKKVEVPSKEKEYIKLKYIKKPVPGFHKIIQRARNDLGLTLPQLAKAINEDLFIIKKTEEGFIPTARVIDKLEKFLGVKLVSDEQPGMN